MTIKAAAIVLSAFLLGVLSTLILGNIISTEKPYSSTTTYVVANAESVREDAEADSSFVTRILGITGKEQPSPYNRVFEDNIRVEKDRVEIKVDNAIWSRFEDTNSMDPVIDEGANAIQIIPKDESEIHVGDIVSYKSNYADGRIIHRVVEIGYDSEGWYCLMKGDNNPGNDPGRIRFDQILSITVAIIY